MSYLDDAFRGLKTNLEITDTEAGLAQSRHRLLRDYIEDRWDLDPQYRSFLTGSYDRHTKTKKLKDVDIFAVLDANGAQSHLRSGPGSAAVVALETLLLERWNNAKGDDHVVVVPYAGEEVASYEVAPVFVRAEGGFWMPRGPGWMASDPNVHAEKVTRKNQDECDGKFVPLVKMIKGINRGRGEPIEPSFLIEVMALQLVDGPAGSYPDEIRWLLANIADELSQDWEDPAGLGDDVNDSATPAQRAAAAEQVQGWLIIAERAIEQGNQGQERAAVETWRELFGNRMPRPS